MSILEKNTWSETIEDTKCEICSEKLTYTDRVLRDRNYWFHSNCYLSKMDGKCTVCEAKISPSEKFRVENHKAFHCSCHQKNRSQKQVILSYKLKEKQKPRNQKLPRKSNQGKIDPVQVTLTGLVIFFLMFSTYYVLGTLSVIAMALGGGMLIYQILSSRGDAFSKLKHGKQGPSIFLWFLLLSPFALATMVAYEGYTLWESPVRMFLLWGMTIAFWSTMLFVPMAVYSKYREDQISDPKFFPNVTVLVPAYNEEKVIAKTIEGLIETDYPKKEIIVIDDGSKDRTLEIANTYADKVKIIHKENGGKATALNYGINFANGEIIVVVDADTIVGRNALKQIVKGFDNEGKVAAVAGNVKVRNRKNLLTNCQALEYITGIQIVRRAFDVFGAITIVPGALGAFRRKVFENTGAYLNDTIVEDFDATVKILKSGLITQGSTKATAYTEAPDTMKDFFKQRKRWYRGNLQVLFRHSDAITNPRYGNLQRMAFPYMIIGMLVTPIVGFVSIGNAIIGVLQGDGFFILQVFVIFLVVHYLMSLLAIRIDDDDLKMIKYAGFLVIGFKQIIDFLLLKAIIEHAFKQKATWTSAKRVGV